MNKKYSILTLSYLLSSTINASSLQPEYSYLAVWKDRDGLAQIDVVNDRELDKYGYSIYPDVGQLDRDGRKCAKFSEDGRAMYQTKPGEFAYCSPISIKATPINTALQTATDNFYMNYIEKGLEEAANQFVARVVENVSKIETYNKSQQFEVYSSLMSLGMANGIYKLENPNRLGKLKIWYETGSNLASSIRSDPLHKLSFEIYKDDILKDLPPLNNAATNIIKSKDFYFDKIYAPITFLKDVHAKNPNINNTDFVVRSIKDASVSQANKTMVIDLIKQRGDMLLKTNSFDKSRTSPPSPFGYFGANQRYSPMPNIMEGPLKITAVADVNKAICAGAIDFLYENPETSIEMAVEAGWKRAAGMQDIMFGNVQARKSDCIKLLRVTNARSLCKVGRWNTHLGMMNSISEFKGYTTGFKYDLDFDKLTQVDKNEINKFLREKPQGSRIVKKLPIKRFALQKVNVGAGDGKYGNCCGYFSSQWNGKQQAHKFLTNLSAAGYWQSIGIDPNKCLTINNSGMLEQPNGFYKDAILDNSLQMNSDIVKRIYAKRTESRSLDCMYLSNMLTRPLRLYVWNGKYIGDSYPVYPITSQGNHEKIRTIGFAHTGYGGCHYNGVFERSDFISKAKLMRHNGK